MGVVGQALGVFEVEPSISNSLALHHCLRSQRLRTHTSAHFYSALLWLFCARSFCMRPSFQTSTDSPSTSFRACGISGSWIDARSPLSYVQFQNYVLLECSLWLFR